MPGNFFNLANSIAGSNNVPLDQIGQGYGQLAGFLQGQPMQNNQAGGSPQNNNTGIFPGGATGQVGDAQFGGVGGSTLGTGPIGQTSSLSAGGTGFLGPIGQSNPVGSPPAAGGMPSTQMVGQTQAISGAPASGSSLGYGQPSPAAGGAFNAGGFGGLGTAFAGRSPGIGARYWSRLNNIGGA